MLSHLKNCLKSFFKKNHLEPLISPAAKNFFCKNPQTMSVLMLALKSSFLLILGETRLLSIQNSDWISPFVWDEHFYMTWRLMWEQELYPQLNPIPHSCLFIYTGMIFKFQIWHLKIPKIYPQKSQICSFWRSIWKNLHLTEIFTRAAPVVPVTNMRYGIS